MPQIFDAGATEEKGEMARLVSNLYSIALWRFFIWDIQKLIFYLQQSFVGAIAVADLVKTTLGPKGMDKIL